MRYFIKHVTDYEPTDPAWYFYHRHGSEWLVWDDDLGATLVGYKTREEALKTAERYESEPDELS